tara:strand:+ start:35 stop:250 length:216 start_codon:yes stop_codon:yes gene_type:complete
MYKLRRGQKMKTFICSLLILTGVFMVAGSAGDCDGKCMEQANTLSEMFAFAGIGLTLIIIGALPLVGRMED